MQPPSPLQLASCRVPAPIRADVCDGHWHEYARRECTGLVLLVQIRQPCPGPAAVAAACQDTPVHGESFTRQSHFHHAKSTFPSLMSSGSNEPSPMHKATPFDSHNLHTSRRVRLEMLSLSAGRNTRVNTREGPCITGRPCTVQHL